MSRTFQPGSLVTLRKREWVVMPSPDPEILMVKPLGGSDEETTGIYLPFNLEDEKPEPSSFPYPGINDIENYSAARILYNAARLSFRDVAGPFRSIGKYSFRPKSYQMVPLIMALKQEKIRLLIADDVGVGKTIEALMIVREMLDRGEIKRFAVVCPPHLCEQWQQEIKDKFSIDAVLVRSSTAAQLDRKIRDDRSIFMYYPYQVISIDYIKSGKQRNIFLSDCPEFVIVDEVHTCTKPVGASDKDQQRFYLINEIANRKNQHLLLLTATPHSGKQEQFQSLLGLLKTEYKNLDVVNVTSDKHKELSSHIIIRRRADVQAYEEEIQFPEREQGEYEYLLSPDYKEVFNNLLKFARGIDIINTKSAIQKRFKYFAVLSLFRGVMSSPLAGIEMLNRKAEKIIEEEIEFAEAIENPVADTNENDSDFLPANLLTRVKLNTSESELLRSIAINLQDIKDNKADKAVDILTKWTKEGYNTVVFCRFIPTAKYLGDYLKNKFNGKVDLLVITGEMVDEERKLKIEEFGKSKNKKILVATDCISEGINLQNYFNAVLHYDLVWNPNKLEQREGRIDRFGQSKKIVKTYMLWGKDNPIDSVVLNVLLKKAIEIRKQTGISVPFPEDSQSILDSLINAVILNPSAAIMDNQLTLELGSEDIISKEELVTNEYAKAADRSKKTRSIFAQHSIKINEIKEDLKETDLAIGAIKDIKNFTIDLLSRIGGLLRPSNEGWTLYTTNLPPILKDGLKGQDEINISFDSPTPEGFIYLGRNHPFIDLLCKYVLNNTLMNDSDKKAASRASVIRTKLVETKTTLMQMRVRNLISDNHSNKELIAEEVVLWGFKGSPTENEFLSSEEAKNLLENAHPSEDLSLQRQEDILKRELNMIPELENNFEKIVYTRSEELIKAHERFRKLVGGNRYKIVEPVLPPDVLGIYILLPEVKE